MLLLFLCVIVCQSRCAGSPAVENTVAQSKTIKSCFNIDNCVPWLDTDGNKIEAHAAGMLQVYADRVPRESCIPNSLSLSLSLNEAFVITPIQSAFQSKSRPCRESCHQSKNTDYSCTAHSRLCHIQSPKDGRWYWYGESKKNQAQHTAGKSCAFG